MSDRRRKEILKRIEKRRKYNRSLHQIRKKTDNPVDFFPQYDEHDFVPYSSLEGMKKTEHPLFKKELFLFKVLASACLVLITAIAFKTGSARLEPVRTAVFNVMEKEFQFAMVADWYEKTFGRPLALFPGDAGEGETKDMKYALPVNGIILEDFGENNQGITIQTEKGESVEAIESGIVTFAGNHEDFGKTVIIQHPDQTETWYGGLGDVKVKVYDHVRAGEEIGTVSSRDDEKTGEFYFAVKQDEKFIDPVQVIKLE